MPIRIELGPKDLQKGSCVLARRDLPGKESKVMGVPLADAPARVAEMLRQMQQALFDRARTRRKEATRPVDWTNPPKLAPAAPMRLPDHATAISRTCPLKSGQSSGTRTTPSAPALPWYSSWTLSLALSRMITSAPASGMVSVSDLTPWTAQRSEAVLPA